MDDIDWKNLSKEEKQEQLYRKQKRMLDTFLQNHAISKEQYQKSLGDLTVKMGMEKVLEEMKRE